MRDNVLQIATSSVFKWLVAILMLYVGYPMNKVTTIVARLGEAKTRHTQKGIQAVVRKAWVAKRDSSLEVTETQM